MEKQIRKAVQMREDLPLEKIRQKHEDWKGTTMPERPQKVNLTRVGAGGDLPVFERNWSCPPRGMMDFIL